MKAETLMNIPVLLPANETTSRAQAAAPTRQFRISWLVPCVALMAAFIAFQAFSSLAQINAHLDAMATFMQSPQF